MTRQIKILGLILAAAMVPVSLWANVSLRNGNFFIGYKDLVYPGGFEPKVERVYNSKSSFKGMFGHGWGSEYEAYLTVSADGSVVVHEYGGGAENRFYPVKFSKKELTKAIDRIAGAARKSGAIGTGGQMKAYKKQLARNSVFRNDEWQRFVSSGKLKRRRLKAGTQLRSNRFSYQYITKLKQGYKRIFDNGRLETFSDSGRLIQISDKNNNFIRLIYTKAGKLQQIIDNFNRKMFFSFNRDGLLSKVEGENGKKSAYRYDNRLLVWSRDAAGNVYQFKYDSVKNLTKITYADKTTMRVAYHGAKKNRSVKNVRDRDGSLTEYDYSTSNKNADKFWVSSTLKNKKGQVISRSRYEYVMKTKVTGDRWTYKMTSIIDGDKTETTYNLCCGLPVKIVRGGEVTKFKYDKKGHVVMKDTPAELTNLSYHKKYGKVTKVVRKSKLRNRTSWSQFQYDPKGNLIYAKNSRKQGVRLFYDRNGRISSMVDQNRRRIDFKYNENSKPIEIKDPKLGTIKVTYTNSGEIKRVESTAGRKIALKVTSAFQNLLDIIRPAGVSLSF